MTTTPRNESEMQLSETELNHLTADLADAHNDTYPAMQASIDAWAEAKHAGSKTLLGDSDAPSAEDASEGGRRGFSRRNFLVTGGALTAGGLILAACGSSSSAAKPAAKHHTAPPTTATKNTAAAALASIPVDVRVAALAASLENLAVATYTAGLKAAGAGKLGKVPPAVATFAVTARAQHAQHAAAWNGILGAVGYDKVTGPDTVVESLVDSQFAKVTNVVGLAKLALELETVAAATYLNGISVVSGTQAIETAATIQPVEMQHVAILNFVLGTYPVPNAFASTVGARPVSDYTTIKKA
jgi:hypothetical protein